MYWKDCEIEELKRLAADGLSRSRIAEELNKKYPGRGLTRNAVIGKCCRLGDVAAANEPRAPRSTKTRETRTNPDGDPVLSMLRGADTKRDTKFAAGGRERKLKAVTLPDAAPKMRAPSLAPDAPPEGCSLFALTKKTCRWPIGDPDHPDFHFCGAPGASMDDKRPYCDHHERLAFNPAVRRTTSSWKEKRYG